MSLNLIPHRPTMGENMNLSLMPQDLPVNTVVAGGFQSVLDMLPEGLRLTVILVRVPWLHGQPLLGKLQSGEFHRWLAIFALVLHGLLGVPAFPAPQSCEGVSG